MARINPFEGKTVFKNATTLDQGWTPDPEKDEQALPCRDDVIRSLSALYRPVIQEDGALSLNSLILGRGGVGKTVTSKYFGRMFRNAALKASMDFTAEYIDCNEHSTRNSILREVLGKLKISTGRGYSDPELMKQMVTHLKLEKKYMFLILDEVHKLEHDDLLAFLNSSITFGIQNVRYSILCISRSEDWLKYSTERLTSRIQKVYNFKHYYVDDANKILKFRHKLAFYGNTFNDDCIAMIATIASTEKNMRNGIEIMRQVALHLDENKLSYATPEMIRNAGGNIISNYDTDLLNYLNSEQEYLVLLSIARYLINKPYVTTVDINEQYQIVCEEYKKIVPLKFATLKRYIKKLEGFGLISKSFALPDGKERGRESRYELNEFAAEKLDEQLTKILDNLYN